MVVLGGEASELPLYGRNLSTLERARLTKVVTPNRLRQCQGWEGGLGAGFGGIFASVADEIGAATGGEGSQEAGTSPDRRLAANQGLGRDSRSPGMEHPSHAICGPK